MIPLQAQLSRAASEGDCATIAQCLHAAADPLYWNAHALSAAAVNNRLSALKMLLEHSPPNTALPLRDALIHNRPQAAQCLWDAIDHHALIDQSSQPNPPLSSLQVACENGWYQHALSLFPYPLSEALVSNCLNVLDTQTSNPLGIELWIKLVDSMPLEKLPILVDQRALPPLAVLEHLARRVAPHPQIALEFFSEMIENVFSEGQAGWIYPLLRHTYPSLSPSNQLRALGQILDSNPLYASEAIAVCQNNNLQFLSSDLLGAVLSSSSKDIVEYTLDLCQSQKWILNSQETQILEMVLRRNVVDQPLAVHQILCAFPSLFSVLIGERFLEHKNDSLTELIEPFMSSDILTDISKSDDQEPWVYWQDYQSRRQHQRLSQTLEGVPHMASSRKM